MTYSIQNAKFDLTPSKTYATRENAIKAVEKFYGDREFQLRVMYFVAIHTDGRFFPVFVGERALHEGIHFKFNVIA